MSSPPLSPSTPETGPTQSDSPAKTPKRNTSIAPMLRRLHFYAGILVAPFLVVATISGAMYAVAPTLENLTYRSYLQADTDGPAKPVAAQVEAAQRVLPDLTPTAVQPGIDGHTTRVLFDDPSLGESLRQSVFIDPATAKSQGTLPVYGSSGALPTRTWIDQLHRNLHLGEPGRIYSELAASWLWVIALGGLALWVNRFRKQRRAGTDARLLTLNRSASTVTPGAKLKRTLDWHGVVGIWLAVGLVFLSATGLTWSRFAGENVSDMRSSLSWNSPSVNTELTGGSPTAADGHEQHGGMAMPGETTMSSEVLSTNISRIDDVLATARAAGLDGVVETSIPADSATAFSVKQSRVPWVFSRDVVAIDGASNTVTDLSRFADWPFAAKLAEWGIQLHMGILFGIVSQLALLALCIALLTVIVRGYVMWWRRRPTGKANSDNGIRDSVGAPPASGAWRDASLWAIAGVVAVAALVGWFIPLLGISLLTFLVVDAGARAVKRLG
ncbi:PepSY-associated TM helix domain-containing protein [Gordonia sp. CPCC 205333]|uniref:PepSY-associated TM helix domain-containing protein n=1 Tax=Gordonia sp. CPCC 205333 TaxID=3140790 RepID=UPI003AF39542